MGNWGFGNEFELLAGLRKNGLDPDSDVTLVQQNFDMLALISGDIDAAQAMTYNEYAQVLETVNPGHGRAVPAGGPERHRLETMKARPCSKTPCGPTLTDWRPTPTTATPRCASWRLRFGGWAHCRDNPDDCVGIVLDNVPTLGESHQAWQLNEVSSLIWPSPLGAGVMDPDLWAQTVEIATSEGILAAAPDDGAFRTDIAEEALANLREQGVDVVGSGFERVVVELREGGE